MRSGNDVMKDIDKIMWVIGIVDAYGAVHSHIILMYSKETDTCHGDLWPGNLKRWRWSKSDGLMWGIGGRAPDEFDEEEKYAIEMHLERLGMSEDQIWLGS